MMKTPIADFVRDYAARKGTRLHMPGHKGMPFLGCETWDITEVSGADALYEAEGIIAESEKNAAALFGAAATVFGAEGSSQCIKTMVLLATQGREKPWILAGRNAHKAFLYALALCDVQVKWLWPQEQDSICACAITAWQVEQALKEAATPPAAVYVTSPDYLGNLLPIGEIAEVCHRYGTKLLVDNAHGAYLKFLPQSLHPISQGADICCDSAHKTLPVLTGGAYLHFRDTSLAENAKAAMAMFGSTSPSYLILASLDLCNRYLAENIQEKLEKVLPAVGNTKKALKENGWTVVATEPMKITLRCDGHEVARRLRKKNIECEFADRDYLVLMPSAETTAGELAALVEALGRNDGAFAPGTGVKITPPQQAMTPRQAMFAPQQTIAVADALGRVAAAPTVGCPPAVPIVVSGERIDESAQAAFAYYGMDTVCVVK